MSRFRIAAAVVLATLAAATSGSAVELRCDGGATSPGASIEVHMQLVGDPEAPVAGTQNDLLFDPQIFSGATCAINPDIGPGTDANKMLQTNVIGDTTLRAIIVALDSVALIPRGELYTCTFAVAGDAPLGEVSLTNTGLVASSPDGTRLPVTGTDCAISIGPTPTPTPRCRENSDCPEGEVCVDGTCVTPTPTNTPIGFCDEDDDCPEGQVCVNHQCVTPTPTVTPIGFCTDNGDCPPGQVCVDHRCVTPTATVTATPRCRENSDCPSGEVCLDGNCVTATPTAIPTATSTIRRSSGGGGCSCEIDPGAGPQATDVFAVALPVLVLVLRWRSRRRAR